MPKHTTPPDQLQLEFSEYPYTPRDIKNYAPWVAKYGLRAPYGKCQCCCGADAPIATFTSRKWGVVEGKPQRFTHGHNGRKPLAERFWAQVDKASGPNACWLWMAATCRRGYGRIGIDTNKIAVTSRVSWELTYGPIPNGLHVLHRCDNPPCVNPAHLFLGTQADNNADKLAKNRGTKGDTHGTSKLAENQIREIRSLHSAGIMQKDIATRFNVSKATVNAIVHRRTWKHVI